MARALAMGEYAVLIDCETHAEVRAYHAEALRRRERGLLTAPEIVPAARTVLIDGVDDAAAVARDVEQWMPDPQPAPVGATVEIAVRFDGPDLGVVAGHWGVQAEVAVARLLGARLEVAFCGFAPGFAYLEGLEGEVPRRAVPRTSVPAGSLGLAGPYAGIYPRASPGGWQIVGTAVDVDLWDERRDPPALLVPGARVRLIEAT